MNPFRRSEQLQRWLDEYAADHRDPRNRAAHALCIPLIILSLLGLLQAIPGQVLVGGWGVPFGAAEAFLALVLTFYAQHDLKLTLLLAPLGAAGAVLAGRIPLWAHVAIALSAWTLQLAGHALWEKNRPSFSKNLVQALVGPLYFLDGLLGPKR